MKHRSATKSKSWLLLRNTCLIVLLAVTVGVESGAIAWQATSVNDASSEFSTTLRGIAAAGRLPDLRWPDFSDYRVLVSNFYESSGYRPSLVKQQRANSTSPNRDRRAQAGR